MIKKIKLYRNQKNKNTVHNTKENTNNNRNVKIGKYVTENHYISITYEIEMSDYARCIN